MPSHCLNRWWFINNWDIGKIFQWNLNKINIFSFTLLHLKFRLQNVAFFSASMHQTTWYKDNANERNGIGCPRKLWIEDDNHQLRQNAYNKNIERVQAIVWHITSNRPLSYYYVFNGNWSVYPSTTFNHYIFWLWLTVAYLTQHGTMLLKEHGLCIIHVYHLSSAFEMA